MASDMTASRRSAQCGRSRHKLSAPRAINAAIPTSETHCQDVVSANQLAIPAAKATTSQGPHSLRDQLADVIFRVPKETVRVVTPEVGGGFGMKIFMYPELPLVLFAVVTVQGLQAWPGKTVYELIPDEAQMSSAVFISKICKLADPLDAQQTW